METATAYLKQYRQSPRKVRLVADFVRGKNAKKAIAGVSHLTKRSSPVLKKLIESALSNAKNKGLNEDNLFIKEIRVDSGVTLHRYHRASRGRATPIRKRASHIKVVLEERDLKSVKSK